MSVTNVSLTFSEIMQGPILRAVHDWDFKGGVFKSSITKDTSIIDAMNIFIASPHLSQSEKESAKTFRDNFRSIREKYPGDDIESILNSSVLAGGDMDGMLAVFKNDANAHGLRITPGEDRLLSDDRTVDRTIV